MTTADKTDLLAYARGFEIAATVIRSVALGSAPMAAFELGQPVAEAPSLPAPSEPEKPADDEPPAVRKRKCADLCKAPMEIPGKKEPVARKSNFGTIKPGKHRFQPPATVAEFPDRSKAPRQLKPTSPKSSDKTLCGHGPTKDKILACIEVNGRCGPRDIAPAIGCTVGAVNQALLQLMAKGLLRKPLTGVYELDPERVND